MNAGAGTVYSARSYVLAWILIPVVLIIAVDTFALYRNALRSVGAAYDRTLLATAHAVGDAVRYEKGRFRVSLPLALFEIYEAAQSGRYYYRISTHQGELISGDEDLPVYQGDFPRRAAYPAVVQFYETEFRDQPMRVAVLEQPVFSGDETGRVVIQVAEPLAIREASARDILEDTLLRQGLLLALVPLGLGAGALGSLVTVHRDVLALVGGVVLIAFGLVQALGVPFRIPGVERRGDPRGRVGAVLLGATYGLAGACTGPLLGAVLTVAAVGGSPAYGAVLLAFFALGMVVPLLVLAVAWERLRLGERARPRRLAIGPFTTTWFQVVSGALFVAIGVLFLVTDATASLGGLLDASAQAAVEGWLRGVADGVPDLAVVGVLAAAAALVAWRRLRRR